MYHKNQPNVGKYTIHGMGLDTPNPRFEIDGNKQILSFKGMQLLVGGFNMFQPI